MTLFLFQSESSLEKMELTYKVSPAGSLSNLNGKGERLENSFSEDLVVLNQDFASLTTKCPEDEILELKQQRLCKVILMRSSDEIIMLI